VVFFGFTRFLAFDFFWLNLFSNLEAFLEYNHLRLLTLRYVVCFFTFGDLRSQAVFLCLLSNANLRPQPRARRRRRLASSTACWDAHRTFV
jgi:hypothetical protein